MHPLYQKVGLPPSTIFRLERCAQSITLGRLDAVLTKLKRTLADVVGEGYQFVGANSCLAAVEAHRRWFDVPHPTVA